VEGRFKVFSHLELWFEEFRGYHHKDHKIIDRDDDLMAATRYALMSQRFAQAPNARLHIPKVKRAMK
jgi:Terminase RNaseH-like domain